MSIRLMQLLVFFSVSQLGNLFPQLAVVRPFLVIAIATFLAHILSGKGLTIGVSRDVKMMILFTIIVAFCEVLPAVFHLDLPVFMEALSTWLTVLVVFLLIFNVVRSERDVQKIFSAVILAVMVHLFVGFSIYLYAPESMLENRLGTYGMYAGANDYGLLLTCSIPIFLKRAEDSKLWAKAFYYAVAAVALYHIFLTGSRGAFIGTTIVIVLCIWNRVQSFKAVRVVLIAFILIVVAVAGGEKLAQLRPGVSLAGGDSSADDRLDAWAACGRMLLANPLGVGFEQSRERIQEYAMERSMPPHNTYVKVAAEAGVIGYFAYVLVLYLAISRIVKIEYFYRVISPNRKAIVLQILLFMMIGFAINTSLSQKEYEWLLYIALACSARLIDNESEVLRKNGYWR